MNSQPRAVPAAALPQAGDIAQRDPRRIALVHDWLPGPGLAGGEQVLREIAGLCPAGEIFTLFDFLDPVTRDSLRQALPLHTSRLNRLPLVRHYWRALLPSAMRAVEEFDLRGFDLVVSSSSALAKGVITGPGQPHLAYIHSPPRYAWDLAPDYLTALSGPLAPLQRVMARGMMHQLRLWDLRCLPSVDLFIANSEFIRRRIWKLYRREAEVIFPPVDLQGITLNAGPRDSYYVTVSRLVPYKRLDLILEAFRRRPALRLIVIGTGPQARLLARQAPRNVRMAGHLPEVERRRLVAAARGFVFAACEDFGIAAVEAQAAGTPVIALGQGGTAETLCPLGAASAPTGVHFDSQSVESLMRALDLFEAEARFDIRSGDCRSWAERFSQARFRREFATVLARY